MCSEASASGQPVKWEDVHGLLAEAVYGGRVDNAFDGSVLQTFISLFFADEGRTSHNRAAPLSQGVVIPASRSLDDYVNIVKNFPEQDAPYMFGLPANIDRSLQITVGQQFMLQLRMLTRASHLTGVFNREVNDEERVCISSNICSLCVFVYAGVDDCSNSCAGPVAAHGSGEIILIILFSQNLQD